MRPPGYHHNGFMATRGHFMEHGMDSNVFDKFERVYSGHYHMRSNKENVFYLGNPYEMYWNDVNDRNRGFHLFDIQKYAHHPTPAKGVCICLSIVFEWCNGFRCCQCVSTVFNCCRRVFNC